MVQASAHIDPMGRSLPAPVQDSAVGCGADRTPRQVPAQVAREVRHPLIALRGFWLEGAAQICARAAGRTDRGA